jgi:uncharacterized protein (DUF1501 family)
MPTTPPAPPTEAVASLHPECPDLARLGPNRTEALLRARAARQQLDEARRRDQWSRGFTRRRFLAGAGVAAGVTLADQLVTTRVSFGATDTGTLVVVMLRGGMDGLSVIVPADDMHLIQARPDIVVRAGSLLPLARGFGLHPALEPLHPLWQAGKLTAVPAVATPDLSRSHFQAQDCLERGGSGQGTTEGWLDRVLDKLGPGTTFRAVGAGSTLPRSLAGDQPSLSVKTIETFKLEGGEELHDKTKQALSSLYTGLEHPLAGDVATTLSALDTAETLNASGYQTAAGANYPDDSLGKGLQEVAQLIKSDVGVRVAAVELGGWDHHTWLGTVDNGAMKNMLTGLGQSLGAFATDLGDRLDDVTVVTMTEFGRRIEQNANSGTDHGHGTAMLLLGGGLRGGAIHGNWMGLAPEVRDQGDVPGANDYRNVLGELVGKRLGLSAGDLGTVFPGHQYAPVGVTS